MLSVLTFRTPAEAIAKANNTPYGLSAGIWSEKGSRILAVADKLRAGVVWANTFNRFDPASPFGGYKESGYGREGGRHGLAAYLKPAPRTASGQQASGGGLAGGTVQVLEPTATESSDPSELQPEPQVGARSETTTKGHPREPSRHSQDLQALHRR